VDHPTIAAPATTAQMCEPGRDDWRPVIHTDL